MIEKLPETVIGESVYNLSQNDDFKNILTYLSCLVQDLENQIDSPVQGGVPLELSFHYPLILAKRREAVQAVKNVVSELERAKQAFLKKREEIHERRERIPGGSESNNYHR